MKIFGSLTISISLLQCTVGTPFKGPGYSSDKGLVIPGDSQTVILALTQARLDTSKRKKFDEETWKVYKTLDQHPGYIAGSIRKKILGDTVFTMSVWKDKESLRNFVNSRVHVSAMYMGDSAIQFMRSQVKEIPASQLPVSWEQAEIYLQEKPLREYKPL